MIRNATLGDVKQIIDIYNYYVLNTNVSLEVDEVSEVNFIDRMLRITEKYPFIVYEEDGVILGYAYLDKFAERKAYFPSVDLSIYVSKDAKAKGIGTELYKEIEELAIKNKYSKIVSIVTGKNTCSLAFHKKMGFKEVGTFKKIAFKNNEWIDVIYLDKDI